MPPENWKQLVCHLTERFPWLGNRIDQQAIMLKMDPEPPADPPSGLAAASLLGPATPQSELPAESQPELPPTLQPGFSADPLWEQLPLVTASVLETHYYTQDNPLAEQPDMNCYRTSGTSSGRRKAIFYSERDEEHYLRVKLDVFRSILEPYGYRTAVSDMGTGHAEATAAAVFRSLGMSVETLPYQLPIRDHIELLERKRPEVLYTMPSILDRILAAAEQPEALGICHVVLVGEIASPGWRRRVAERLGIPERHIADTFGSIEIGTLAHYNPELNRYVLADGLFAEGVPAEALGEGFEPLPEGEAVLVLTSAIRDSFPALRYVTYDVIRDLQTQHLNGRPRQTFASIVKRIGPDLKHGEKISIYDIEDAVSRHLPDAVIRIHVAGNALRVLVDSGSATDKTLAQIRDDIEHRNPDIGGMIRSGILNGIEVVPDSFSKSAPGSVMKQKKIYYEQRGDGA
ncbi:CoF synthetase [Paenibacillus pasadenensis]|uniref:CoF synthetase n=1 Tax=Paenibacillus pasadenensis TaxID=217090 RepID=UPI00203B47AA|nr:CoF synthetase [Paenibacillus pasadenensis]MCM3748112.1 CoF synthetase [Paenibacillus pasadenensis]